MKFGAMVTLFDLLSIVLNFLLKAQKHGGHAKY